MDSHVEIKVPAIVPTRVVTNGKMMKETMNATTETEIRELDVNGEYTNTLSRELSTKWSLTKEIGLIYSTKGAWTVTTMLLINVLYTIWLQHQSVHTNYLALTAFAYLSILNSFSLVSCLISYWVSHQKCTALYSFGFERVEVLAVFTSTVLVQVAVISVLRYCLERIFQSPNVVTSTVSMTIVATFGLILHLLITFCISNRAFNHVSSVSDSNWLQNFLSTTIQSVFSLAPSSTRAFVKRINPFALVTITGWIAMCIADILISINHWYQADTVAALIICILTWATLYPMSIYSGKILLQTNPAQILPQIDKCLREISTLDGVLEIKEDHFWMISFGNLAGSVQVRVRRDADDQIVLLQVTERLSRYVSNLTVQIIKDDWQRTVSNPTILRSMNYGDKNMLENYNFSSFSNDTVYYTPTKDRSNMISASTPLIFEQRGH
ncbi:Zinc transporter 6 [Trichoplax sp. H2]|nr:Zinc transporter 6 [Trichoplax sp. H2]|eukprot:RDD44828.1 Zinc transporter 6 [Trichoplax sp. H2]